MRRSHTDPRISNAPGSGFKSDFSRSSIGHRDDIIAILHKYNRKFDSYAQITDFLPILERIVRETGDESVIINNRELRILDGRQISQDGGKMDARRGDSMIKSEDRGGNFTRESRRSGLEDRIIDLRRDKGREAEKTRSSTKGIEKERATLRHSTQSQQASTSLPSKNLIRASSPLNTETDCVVCLEPKTPYAFPDSKITATCTHDANVCFDCLSQSISVQMETNIWDQIDCPSCRARLTYQDIFKFADEATYEKYDALTLQTYLSSPTANFQSCSQPGCKSGQQYHPNDSFIKCQACGHRTCVSCGRIWHPRQSCAEFAPRDNATLKKEEAQAKTWLKRHSKNCPKCKAPSVKIDGCDHMTCPQCRYQYCWLCLADWTDINLRGNEYHNPTCRYHTNNLGGSQLRDYNPIIPQHNVSSDDEDDNDLDTDARPYEPWADRVPRPYPYGRMQGTTRLRPRAHSPDDNIALVGGAFGEWMRDEAHGLGDNQRRRMRGHSPGNNMGLDGGFHEDAASGPYGRRDRGHGPGGYERSNDQDGPTPSRRRRAQLYCSHNYDHGNMHGHTHCYDHDSVHDYHRHHHHRRPSNAYNARAHSYSSFHDDDFHGINHRGNDHW